MNETLVRLLLRLSEAGDPAILWGREAAPHFGKDFERLLDRRVLVEQAPAEEWDVCSACDCGLDARPIQTINDQPVAACPFDQCNDQVLQADDLRSFRIHSAELAREIAIASGFGNQPSEIMPGLWHLGQTSGHRELLLAVTRVAAEQPGLIAKLRLLNPSAQVVMVAPLRSVSERATFTEAGILVVGSDESIGGAFVIDPAKLEAPQASVPRLVIRRAAKTVSIDGHTKTLPDQSFQLLLLMAEHALKSSGILENRVIEGHLWGSNIHKITSQAREPVRALRNALATDGLDAATARKLIENRRNPNGYRLTLFPDEIQIAP